jgi:hypothetical protein
MVLYMIFSSSYRKESYIDWIISDPDSIENEIVRKGVSTDQMECDFST